ncbi:Hypothetical predicted protein, partial [Marmota monax]
GRSGTGVATINTCAELSATHPSRNHQPPSSFPHTGTLVTTPVWTPIYQRRAPSVTTILAHCSSRDTAFSGLTAP